ncbi:DUF2335 domain-containing protein [Photobacterium leiognathi]|uniref:DUF2335 domain-containing protein n=1 Tax=Photobacterium leiognathi TaxID=553611 RepID=UPI000769EB94|nr:DUF2335 domain-containing protein [Photobacterium leiognathi]
MSEHQKQGDSFEELPDTSKVKVQSNELKELLKQLPEEVLAEALADRVTSHDAPKEITKVVQAVAQEYSGPIPPPRMLNDYENVQSGLAERIVAMAEKEQSHRHALEDKAVTGEISKDKRGQNYALLSSLVIILGSIGLIYTGHEVSGSILAGGTLTGLAYIFISGRKSPEERQDSSG